MSAVPQSSLLDPTTGPTPPVPSRDNRKPLSRQDGLAGDAAATTFGPGAARASDVQGPLTAVRPVEETEVITLNDKAGRCGCCDWKKVAIVCAALLCVIGLAATVIGVASLGGAGFAIAITEVLAPAVGEVAAAVMFLVGGAALFVGGCLLLRTKTASSRALNGSMSGPTTV